MMNFTSHLTEKNLLAAREYFFRVEHEDITAEQIRKAHKISKVAWDDAWHYVWGQQRRAIDGVAAW